MIGEPSFHSGRDAQRLENAGEVVMQEMQGNGVLVIIQLFVWCLSLNVLFRSKLS